MEKIKLVIWDLDETFWKGTISENTEESIHILESNINIIKELTNRGIINSICSKNDFNVVKKVLSDNHLWDYFVFPSIAWKPKGEAVKEIIEKCQLRPVNTLFIDDNTLNIKEVEFYNKGINVAYPEFIDNILTHESFIGKDDSEHTRLQQYKLLEMKESEKAVFSSNIEFLKESDIKITYLTDLIAIKDRIIELFTRTNQLNFTKIRLNESEINSILQDNRYEQKAISVSDKYGDYGIVGYYCLDRKENKLLHFMFSCRILNMGIEQFIYSNLNFPEICIIPETAITLDNSHPNWISKSEQQKVKKEKKQKQENQIRILFKGGCDLASMLFYLKNNGLTILEETNYTGENNVPIHNDHTQVLKNSINLSKENLDYIESKLPFFDTKSHITQVFDNNYEILVLSVLMDYTQNLYRHKEKNFIVPFGSYNFNILTDKEQHKEIEERFLNRNMTGFSQDFLERFSQEYELLGLESPEIFENNLREIRSLVDSEIPIIFLNGSEVTNINFNEKGCTERHYLMNKVLSDFISSSKNCYLLDVRKYIKNASDTTDNIRHYQREKYHDIGLELINILRDDLHLNIEITNKKNITKYITQKTSAILRKVNSVLNRN